MNAYVEDGWLMTEDNDLVMFDDVDCWYTLLIDVLVDDDDWLLMFGDCLCMTDGVDDADDVDNADGDDSDQKHRMLMRLRPGMMMTD